LRAVCREGDALARLGGDEFIILLPKTTREETTNILNLFADLMGNTQD
jgi:GGDEF domain-containing protein